LTKQADINRLDGRAKLSKLAKPLLEKFPNGVLKKLVLERLSVLTQVSTHDLLGIEAPVPQEQFGSNFPTKGGYSNQNFGNSSKSFGNRDFKGNNFRKSGRQAQQQSPRVAYITPVRRAVSLILQHPNLHTEFAVLQAIPDEQVRGIGMVHELRKACEENASMTTATLLERYRDRSFASTLSLLANHEHNNLDTLLDDDAIALIRGTMAKIIEDYNSAEVVKATQELEGLSKRSIITELNADETARKEALTAYIRASYK
jgi:DNA primase